MAVTDHIKTASAELMKAADMVKVEIEDLRRQKSRLQRELETRIADDLLQVQHLEHDLRRITDPRQSPQVQTALARMQREIADLRAQLREQQRDIENAIRQKSGMVSGLEMQARAIIS